MKYTTEQREFITATDSRIVLSAPAGTGKTESIAERAALATHPVLVSTFTHAARDSIQNRLKQASAHSTKVRTIVSLAVETVLDHYPHLSIGDGSEILRRLCARTPVKPQDVQSYQSCLVNDAPIKVGALSTDIDTIYRRYEHIKQVISYADFHDCVRMATELNPAYTYRVSELIVDEAQDVSPLMWSFIQALQPETLVLAGDPDQSLFTWSGVNPQFLPDLVEEEGYKELRFTESHRVPQGLLPLVNHGRTYPLTSSIPGGTIERISTTYKDAPALLAPRLQKGDVVLGTSSRRLAQYRDAYRAYDGRRRTSTSWDDNLTASSVQFSTVHSFKGRQAQRVILTDTRDNEFLDRHDTADADRKKLFYVAASRAQSSITLLEV